MLKAGVGRVDTTPPLGVELQGYGWFSARAAQGVTDPLQVTAVVVESGDSRAGIASCDLLGVPGAVTQEVRRVAATELGIAPDNLLVAATHTHHGPATLDLIGMGEVSAEYVSSLPARIIAALRQAAAEPEPVTLWRGVTRLPGFQTNRVYGEGGPLDDRLWIAALRRRDGSPLAVLANYNCHPVTRDKWPALISRDWPGVAADTLEDSLAGARFLFLQGAQGDVNPVHRERSDPAATEVAGRAFAEAVLDYLPALEQSKGEEIVGAVRQAALQLQVQPADEVQSEIARSLATLQANELSRDEYQLAMRDYIYACSKLGALAGEHPDVLSAPLQALCIGDVLIAAQPFELYNQFAVALRERVAWPHTWVVGCANDLLGYVGAPLPDSLADSPFYSYASHTAPMIWGHFRFRDDVGDVLVEELAGLAQAVTW